jgi:hypothetical protein
MATPFRLPWGFILPGVKTPRYKIDRGYAPSIQIKHVRHDRLKKHLKGTQRLGP